MVNASFRSDGPIVAPEVQINGIANSQSRTDDAPNLPSPSKAIEIEKPSAKSQPQNVKILVAEDNKVNQEVIVRMLKLEKMTDVTVAEDGIQAVEQVRVKGVHGFSIIFMDIQMPNMDGIEATKQIREMGLTAPIVALTAFDHETNREACSKAGMDVFMGKPLKRKALRDTLEMYIPKQEAS